MHLLLNATPIALWHQIIHEAQAMCDVTLKEELESYLVFLMVRYTNKPEVVKNIIAYEFLRGIKLSLAKRQKALQEVGDQCLIFAGLFPHIADKRLVRISYFIDMGQSAYATLSTAQNDIYALLAKQFVGLMDILQSIKQFSKDHIDLSPLEAYELWNDTGSKRALSVLKQYTQSTPIFIDIKNK
jgi:hypothetical protein